MSQNLKTTGRDNIGDKEPIPARPTTVSVILPAYNEASTIGTIINQVLELTISGVQIQLIIVESNSGDGTREIVSSYSRHPNVKLVFQDEPKGKGNAVREGFSHATGDVILIQDGDLEYRVDEYSLVLNPILRGEADFVLGCRHTPGKAIREFAEARFVSRVMNLAHWAFTIMFNLVYGTKLRDPFTMYKVFRRECIEGITFESNRFDFDWELVGKLVRLGYVPLEVSISYQSRGFGSGKKVRFFRDPLTWLVALIKFRFISLKTKPKVRASQLRKIEKL